jgi:hypothetical protein
MTRGPTVESGGLGGCIGTVPVACITVPSLTIVLGLTANPKACIDVRSCTAIIIITTATNSIPTNIINYSKTPHVNRYEKQPMIRTLLDFSRKPSDPNERNGRMPGRLNIQGTVQIRTS